MLMTKVVGAIALCIAFLTGISATADPDACKGAMLVFKSAKNGVGGTRLACRAATATTIARASLRSFAQRKTISNCRCRVTTANACNDLAGFLCQCTVCSTKLRIVHVHGV